MDITSAKLPGLIAFLKTLHDVPDEPFRKLILSAEVVDVTKAASTRTGIRGTVRYDGPRPARRPIALRDKNGKLSDCHQLHKEGLLNEELLVSENSGIANAFVYVKKGYKIQNYPAPKQPAVLDQVGCMFRPRIQGVMVGQPLVMKNGDPVLHNVRSLSFRNRPFNIAQPADSPERSKVFRKREKAVMIQCDLHPWMRAWYFVMDHPWFAVTDGQGNFSIDGLEPGEYKLAAWHEKLGEQTITIDTRASADANFSFKPVKSNIIEARTAAPVHAGGNATSDPSESTEQPPRPFVRKWTVDDFSLDIDEPVRSEASIKKGQTVFSAAGCIKCHVRGEAGEKYGPSLTEVKKRFTGKKLLAQILNPSLEIHKDFQTRMFLLDDGRRISGLVTRETPTAYHILPNPLQPDTLRIVQKGSIDEEQTSKVSTMPEGLLDTFSRFEIRSLIAFLQLAETESTVKNDVTAPMRSRNWPQWRGAEFNGVSRTATPPTTWSDRENIKWRARIDGNGGSTPIVWEDKVFLLTAVNTGEVDPSLPKPEDQPKRVFGIKFPNTRYEFVVLCLDRDTGKELWRRTASSGIPHEGHHHNNDFASASPVTDGKHLFCWFGSAGLFCYDMNGQKIWERNLGKAHVGASLGEGCSPVLHDGLLAIVRDHSRQSTIHVLNAKDGKSLWQKERDEPNAWATPCVIEHSGRTQLVTAASNKVRSYDLYSGEIIWECDGLTGNVIPCPVVEGDLVYCMSGYEGYSLLALPLSSLGKISPDQAAWRKGKDTPYIPSPLLYDGRLYFNKSNQSILTCVDSKTGTPHFGPTRLPNLNGMYASPIAANGRIYLTGRRGMTLVLERGDEFKVLAKNKVEDWIDASAAIAGKQLFLRGQETLYCIEEEK